MEEVFETYEKRNAFYKGVSFFVICFAVFIFFCIFFPNVLSKAPQTLMIILCLSLIIIALGSMFIGILPIKTYIGNGNLILTNSSVSVDGNIYSLDDLLSVETKAGGYKGRGTRGGIDDGTGNKITIITKNKIVITKKFVVTSNAQRNDLAQILKAWRSKGFKIISNGIDLI
jgi:hypothetical protein